MVRSFDGETSTDLQPRLELNVMTERHQPRLAWTDGAGSHVADLDGRVVLGSSSSVAIPIADRAVSRLHAELEVAVDGVWIRDLGSRNGTWIEGTLVRHARIPPSGRFRLGGTELVVSFGAAPSRIPLWPHDAFGPLVARSEVMRELFVRLAQYATSDAPVLVQGETGTGKELVAEALHETSSRAEAPFVVVDCGALPEALLEGELFGYAKGAFTGAIAARVGAFEAADGGTVFLDEIGELPLSMQPKLLRVLESRTVRRLGETEHRKIDVRFVSATHRDLSAMVATGAFREDLYFRLSVLPAYVPPLRRHPDDIPLLLHHFSKGASFDGPLLHELGAHAWPGNVRELRTFVERAKTLGPEAAWAMTRGQETSTPLQLGAMSAPTGELPTVNAEIPFKVLRERWVDHLEREYVRSLIEKFGRNVTAIADHAELDRSYVHRLLRKHDM